MKRLTTYYFLLLGCSNVFFALRVPPMTADYSAVLTGFGNALPPLTKWFIQNPWWPWTGAAVCVTGAALSFWGSPKDNVLRKVLAGFLIAELVVMFLFVVSFVILRFGTL